MREWKTRGDPTSEEEMEHAERQTHQGVHDKIWQRGIQSYSVSDGRETLNGCSYWSIVPQRIAAAAAAMRMRRHRRQRQRQTRHYNTILWFLFSSRLQLLTSISENDSTFILGRFNSVQLHLYIIDFVNITYRCHLLPRFPPLHFRPCHIVHSRVFSPVYDFMTVVLWMQI